MLPSPRVDTLRAEYRTDTPWVGVSRPRLSWTTSSGSPDWIQAGAELELVREGGPTESARIDGRGSVLQEWPFEPLQPREGVSVRVRVRGDDGGRSDWSEPLGVRAGFLEQDQWQAPLIRAAGAGAKAPVLFRREFQLEEPPSRATLYTTSRGVHQAYVNGVEVDDELLKPGWTSYQWRLVHETTDVTSLLRPGANAIGIAAAGGWWTERFGFFDAAKEIYGTEVAVSALLVVEFESGDPLVVTTDETWRATDEGPCTGSGLYMGETHDARRAIPGWAEAGIDGDAWLGVVATPMPFQPTARTAPPVRRTGEIAVREVIRTPSGKQVLDFGQNLVGHVRLRARGARGAQVTLRHGEVLEDGELCVRTLRAAEATDRFVLAGGESETWAPQFTFHGFRYVEVEGVDEVLAEDFVAVVVGSDLVRTGWFESSDPLLNRFHENVVWSMRGNFLAVPTDCPQRDERLGWTGDVQVFAPTASFLYDCNGFLASWLTDLAIEQEHNDGVPPLVVPDVLGEVMPAAAWGDAATVVPSVLHERFCDLGLVRAQYESMRAWADVLADLAGDRMLVMDQFQFGDWLDPTAPPERPEDAKTDANLVACAYAVRTWELVASAARLLGNDDDAARYGELGARGAEAFLAEFVTPNGRVVSDAPAAYALAICFGLYRDEAQRDAMGWQLARLCREAGYRLTTGFVGTPLLCDALTITGNVDAAARLIMQTECPSWLYPVTMGATTIWERWDSLLEDGSVNPGGMTSFNHYALGSVIDWLHRVVAGLSPMEPGYRRFRIEPTPMGTLTSTRVEHLSPHGRISVSWRLLGDVLEVEAEVPANTTAEVRLPGTAPFTIGSGRHEWSAERAPGGGTMGAVSLESKLAEIIDDPQAHATLMEALTVHAPDDLEQVRRQRWIAGKRLGEALNRSPLELLADLAGRFDSLNESRVAEQDAR